MQTRSKMVLPGRGATYAYTVSGPENGTPMVLLHELGGDADRWREVTAPLAEHHRTYAFDLRGHGESDWASEYSLRLMADDMVVAMDELGIRGAVLVGHSLGGLVAYLVAMHRPDLVSRLVVEEALPPTPRRQPHAERPARSVRHDWECIVSLLAEVEQHDEWMWAQLQHLAMPTLVLVGGGNSRLPVAGLEEVARRVPDAELAHFEVGHFVHRNDPEGFAAVVLGWLGRRAERRDVA